MNHSNLYENYSDDSSIRNFYSTKPKFTFPPPPRILSKSVCYSSNSDSSKSGTSLINLNRSFNLTKKRYKKNVLPLLGIYWDIENCQVPKNKSATAVVQRIRETFLDNYKESEFLVVCDVKKESTQIIQELHDAQVMLVHVSSTSKNAADEKLRQSLRRFGELHPSPSGVVLISGDINFAADLSDLRYKRKIRVILVHNANVADALILCANEHYSFAELMKNIPEKGLKIQHLSIQPVFLSITNLPKNIELIRVKNRLRILTENCGGKIFKIDLINGVAFVKYTNLDNAVRAQKRIHGEDVFGNKIKVLPPPILQNSGQRKDAILETKNGIQKCIQKQLPMDSEIFNLNDDSRRELLIKERKRNDSCSSDSTSDEPMVNFFIWKKHNHSSDLLNNFVGDTSWFPPSPHPNELPMPDKLIKIDQNQTFPN